MNLPDTYIQDVIDGLTHSNQSFALYRLPWTDKCHFIWQTSDEVEQSVDVEGLNGKKGFVMAPFRQSEEHPLVVIRPDVVAEGWEEIGRILSLPAHVDALKACHAIEEKAVSLCPDETGEQQYRTAFELFMTPLKENCFQKLVLSRSATQTLKEEFSPLGAFVQACNRYPRMMIYLCHTPVSGTWMGSTPEILLSGQKSEWHTVALAGTMPMKAEVMPTEWNSKNQEEQRCVADYIRRIVRKFGEEMTEKGPYTARAGQLVHLKTDFAFQLKHTDGLGSLLQELHPTPAVCGLPKEETFQFILNHEGYDRRYYSGFIGWLDPQGSTDIYVNLRCMEIAPGKATLYAGGGILPQSEVESEWEETGEKMKTMVEILTI